MSQVSKFVKKPVVIEAMQWTGDNLDALKEWGAPVTYLPASNRPNLGHALIIGTLEDGPNSEAVHIADPLDWIIKGVKGEFYPCKPDIFELTYEKIPDGIVLYDNADRPPEGNCSGWWETALHAGPCELTPGHSGPHSRIGDVLATYVRAVRPPPRAIDDKPIYIYQSPIERQLYFPELLEPLIIGPKASIELRWLRHG